MASSHTSWSADAERRAKKSRDVPAHEAWNDASAVDAAGDRSAGEPGVLIRPLVDQELESRNLCRGVG